MRLIFAGTPEFARVAAEHLRTAGFDIALVLSQPDRPAGRGLKLQSSSVKQWALAHNIPISQPRGLRLDGRYAEEKEYNLNIPRYIDSQEEEDIQDIEAHLNGGIPNADLKALNNYWEVYPSLRNELFAPPQAEWLQ